MASGQPRNVIHQSAAGMCFDATPAKTRTLLDSAKTPERAGALGVIVISDGEASFKHFNMYFLARSDTLI